VEVSLPNVRIYFYNSHYCTRSSSNVYYRAGGIPSTPDPRESKRTGKTMKHQVETTVLRGIDRTLDEEEWPLLELKDATITHHHRRKKAGQLVDLFEVNLHGPFRVKGRLGKLKKHQESLVLGTASKLYKEDIVIPEAYTYSLEIKGDGRIIIWVLGNCGWYALSPAKEYRAIFDQMVEKTKIWLFLEAKYVPAIYKGKYRLRGSAHDVFVEVSTPTPAHLKYGTSNIHLSSRGNIQVGRLQKKLQLYFTSTMSG